MDGTNIPRSTFHVPRSTLHAARSTLFVLALAVLAVTVWTHWPCLRNGFLNWDDDLYLEEVARHPRLDRETIAWAFTTTLPFYYHPLTFLSHVADHELWGNNPWGHHLANLFLHGFNSVLAVVFVWLLLESAGISVGERAAVAGGVALVFGLHPLQVEPVAWVAERKTVLCGAFSLLTMCAYLRMTGQPSRRGWRMAVTLLLAGALLAKPMAMTLPLVMLVLDFYPLRRYAGAGWWALLKEKALLFALCAVDFVLAVIGQSRMGAVMTMQTQSVGERGLVAARAFVFYLWKLVWPAWLCPLYPLGGTITLWQAEFFVPVILVVLGSALAVWLRRRTPALLAAACAYLAFLVPVSGLMQVGLQSVADRFMYLAMLPPLLGLGLGGVWLWRRWHLAGRFVVLLLLCGELPFFIVRTREQIPIWRNSETLWNAVLDHFPRSGIAQGHLALTLADQRRLEEALPHAQAALSDIPDYPVARVALENICSELAVARVEQRQFAAALPYAKQALQSNPTNASVRAMLGLIELKTGRWEEAITELQEALRLNPGLPSAQYNLACAYSRRGRLEQAYKVLQNLFPTQPRFAQLATRDAELNGLRTNVTYGERFQILVGAPRGPE